MGTHDRERDNCVRTFEPFDPVPRPGRRLEDAASALVALGVEPPAEPAKSAARPICPSRPSITITRRTDRPSNTMTMTEADHAYAADVALEARLAAIEEKLKALRIL